MRKKHDVLVEEGLSSYRVDLTVRDAIEQFLRETHEPADRKMTNILDWGCGRSRLQILLRAGGVQASGIDIDEQAMRDGKCSQWLEGGFGRQNYSQT